MAKKSRKVFATTATAALVASAVAPIASSAAGFSDVTKPEYKTAIDALAEAGILNGYENGTFKPENKVTRGEVAKVITLIRHLEEGTKTPFKDVKDGYWSTQYINSLYAAKLVNGYEDGTFKPEGNVTRAEFAKLVVDAYGLTLTNAATPFTDVKAGNWATPYIQTAYANGLIKGVTASKFDPSAPIKRGDLAILLHRADSKFGDVIGNNFPGVELVKATNNTTVEVTFKEKVEDVQALKFSIEGLTVSNAVVKQTDNKTVVLTTSAQKGGELYTVKSGDKTLGKFKGVSAVIPTAVSVVDKAVQGKLGQEVTLKAQVTVAEGQSKAGIPVTFNVPGDNGTLHPTVTGEAVTDENGVATYSYTRYSATEDSVTAYATGDRSKFSTGYVFWGVDTILAVEEVTKESTINNGGNKTYKVTYKNPVTGTPQANVTLNVSFAENLNVTADKVQDAKVNGVQPIQLSNGTAPEAAQITTDSKGEATFTVSGTNTEVTPVVFKAATISNSTAYSKSYSASQLQAKAAKVKFAAVQASYTIEVTRDGKEEAALGVDNGRAYKVVVKDKDGKLAKNEVVNVAFNEDLDRIISTNTQAKFVKVNSDGSQEYYPVTASAGQNTAKQISVKTDDKGEASFVIASDKLNDYATPIAWIDVNTSNAVEGKLDEGEPKTVAPISYFVNAYLDGAALKVFNGDKATDKFSGKETATFKAALVNQSGKTVTGASIKSVTYTVYNTGDSNVVVDGQIVSPNRSYTVTYPVTSHTSTDLTVKPEKDENASVKVVATGNALYNGSDFAFTAKEATATFTSTTAVSDVYTGVLSAFNKSSKTITFTDKDPVKYAGVSGKSYVYKNVSGNTITEKEFEDALTTIASNGKTAKVTYEVKGDTVTLYIIDNNVTGTLEDVADINADLAAAKAKATAANTDEAKYTVNSFAAYKTAYETANALPETTNAEKQAKTTAINSALDNLKSAVAVSAEGLKLTFSPAVNGTAISLADVPATAAASDSTAIASVAVVTVDGTTTTSGTATLNISFNAGKGEADIVDGTKLTITGAKINGVTKDIVLTYSASKWTLTPVEFK